MSKVILFLLVVVGLSIGGVASLMPEIPAFIMQKVLVIEGKDQVPGTFTCECVDMNGNTAPCVFSDFCASCTASGVACNQSPNIPGPYFESAAICGFVTTCP